MQEVATINFQDLSTHSEACAIIQSDGETIALALSLMEDGDTQVLMTKHDAERLIAALSVAVRSA